GLGRGLPDPLRLLEEKSQRLDDRVERLHNAVRRTLADRARQVADLGARLVHPRRQLALARARFDDVDERFAAALARPLALRQAAQALAALGRILETVSYQATLKRGFAVVRGPRGVITTAAAVTTGLPLDIEFADGHAAAVGAPRAGSGSDPGGGGRGPHKTGRTSKGGNDTGGAQGSLL
ncbi:MAG: exodeoxyribonuclease VII large subunit, partial [Alphaproteobacteria bacterium]